MEKALFWSPREDGRVKCHLCPQDCEIRPGAVGICRVRKNHEGSLQSLNYGRISALALDPTEKKPLYHFYPGSMLASVGTVGCNLRCGFCQNYGISQASELPDKTATPEQLVSSCIRARQNHPRMVGIAYTYNEPLVWYEYVLHASRLSRDAGLVNVLVTNGFINEEPLREILPLIDAANIDLKGFSDDYYRQVCHGRLEPVLRTIQMSHAAGCHIEITTLLVTGKNDSIEEVVRLSQWIASIDRSIPLHLSRYFPNYKFDLPPTPLATIKAAREAAMQHLDYVYTGNVWDGSGSMTMCPGCRETVIERQALELSSWSLKRENRCPKCGHYIKIRGEATAPKGE